MNGKASDNQAGIGVVARSAALLRTLGDASSGMSLGQIAKQISLPRSTVQRLVGALEAEGLVMTGTGAGRITLGPEFMRLAGRARPAIINRVRPVMERLSAELQETVDFSSIQRTNIVFLEQVVGNQRLLAVSHVGDAFPLHCSSVGKAYLATLTPDEIVRRLGEKYEGRTPKTLTSFDALLAGIEEAKSTGVGVDCEEHTEGICAAGIAFEDDAGSWYGLSLPMPVARFTKKKAQALKLLREVNSEIMDIISGRLAVN